MECKHIKNIFEDVYFTKTSFHITLKITLPKKNLYTAENFGFLAADDHNE
jgi:hypothetical protein